MANLWLCGDFSEYLIRRSQSMSWRARIYQCDFSAAHGRAAAMGATIMSALQT
jgi:hypothetical protein